MIQTLESIPLEKLESMLAEQQLAFEQACNDEKPSFELNEIYKQLKAIRLEVNLRRIG
jgi:hypothetical protein